MVGALVSLGVYQTNNEFTLPIHMWMDWAQDTTNHSPTYLAETNHKRSGSERLYTLARRNPEVGAHLTAITQ